MASARLRADAVGMASMFCMLVGAKRITQLPLSALASLGTLNFARIVMRFWSTSSASSGWPMKATPG